MESVKQWYNFWFKFGSPVSMGVFRAIMGGLIFINLVIISPYFSDWFAPSGYLPATISGYALDGHVRLGQGSDLHLVRINLLQGIESPVFIGIFYGITMLAALLTCLGLWSRLSTIVLAIGIVSIHHRTTLVLHGGDTVIRLMALYMAIAPSGAAFSLDRLFAVRKGTAPLIPALVSMWPQRLIAYNCSLIYLTTTWAKWFGQLWKSGDAAWYPARLHEFERFPVPPFLNNYPMVKLATYGTLAVEFGLATLVWFKPLRKWVLLAGVGLHLYIDYSMNIPLFSYLMMTMYVAYFEGEEVVAWWDKVKGRFTKKS